MQALDAYLDGLGLPDGNVRNKCRKAIESIHEKALPLIEARLDTNPPSARAVAELQQIYEKFIPEEQNAPASSTSSTPRRWPPRRSSPYAKTHTGDAANGKKIFMQPERRRLHQVPQGRQRRRRRRPLARRRRRQIPARLPRRLDPLPVQADPRRLPADDDQAQERQRRAGHRPRRDRDASHAGRQRRAEDRHQEGRHRQPQDQQYFADARGPAAGMKPEEFADVVAYLEGLKEPVKK